jgi:hypothetical protein
VVDDGAVHKDHVAMRALCAAIILDLKVRSTKHLKKNPFNLHMTDL